MKTYFIIAVVFLSNLFGYGQKLKVIQGDFNFIKDQKEINVEFVYDNMKLLKKNLSNEDYVKEHSAELEEETRGKGTSWEKSWYASRELIYAPKFLELMNRYLYEDHNVFFAENLTDANYTLIVETIWVYPGWDAGVMKQPAKVSTLLKFVETTNREHIALEVSSENAPGDQWGSSFNNEDRLGEGYAKTGKSFAKLILKKGF
ncbi:MULTISPECIES: hypothetical protein [unclassified Arenibacter]|uniref:hypothetical protein n=1 Tax=unclassified Arenibacter TaxID=2615047 RepID=UPI000E354AE0|nr:MULTISPECIES: hypothetical protein [unclassified Arenibacter]MCM4165272.1 hypothetical protein [Arenibacter sp. A80]RFT55125.1 hypothetical protein D0S24_16865 [Arenibacter sp. P308M17]